MVALDFKAVHFDRFVRIGDAGFVDARVIQLFFGGVNLIEIGQK